MEATVTPITKLETGSFKTGNLAQFIFPFTSSIEIIAVDLGIIWLYVFEFNPTFKVF